MFVLKILIITVFGTLLQATHDKSFPTMEECNAFGPSEVARLQLKFAERFPGTKVMGRCETGSAPEDDGEDGGI